MKPTSPAPWVLLLLLVLTTTLFTCCDDDDIACSDETNPECPNYDPCHDRKTPVSAAFTMGHPMRAGEIWGMGDTILYAPVYDRAVPCSDITFIASDATADSYRWQVDENPANARTGRSFTMSFPDWTLGQTISVRLITERLSDSTCANVALLRDTVVRQFEMVAPRQTNLLGTFRGSWSHEPNNILDITLSLDTAAMENVCQPYATRDTIFKITNLFGLGCEIKQIFPVRLYINGGYLFDFFAVRQLGCLGLPMNASSFEARDIHVTFSDSDSIQLNCKMSYFYTDAPARLERPVFTGTRI